MALAEELRLCPKNSEEPVGGFTGKSRIRSVAQKDCTDRGGENGKKKNWEAREGGGCHHQFSEMPVPTCSSSPALLWGELTSWCCSSTSIKWG